MCICKALAEENGFIHVIHWCLGPFGRLVSGFVPLELLQEELLDPLMLGLFPGVDAVFRLSTGSGFGMF